MFNTAETLRACRRFRGLSQRELAERSGISKYLICHYENDRSTPNVDRLVDLLNALGFDLEVRQMDETVFKSIRR